MWYYLETLYTKGELSLKYFEPPTLAQGKSIPILESEFKQRKEEYERKRQFRHDWMIATASAISGAIFGFLTSLVFWLIEK